MRALSVFNMAWTDEDKLYEFNRADRSPELVDSSKGGVMCVSVNQRWCYVLAVLCSTVRHR